MGDLRNSSLHGLAFTDAHPVLRLVTPPESEPVSAAEVRASLRLDDTAEDALIDDFITVARLDAENRLRRALVTQTWELHLDQFPAEIRLERPRIQSVSSITYIDSAGATQTLSSSLYKVVTSAEPGLVVPSWGNTWPSTRDEPDSVTVTFVAGYGDNASDVPVNVRRWIILLAGHLFEHREATVEKSLSLNPYVDGLLDAASWGSYV